jgi:hypothetical protein
MNNEDTGKRRKTLQQMKDERPETVPEDEELEGAEMLGFVKTLKEQKDKRTKQYKIIKDLFDDPLTFDLDKEVIPTASTIDEISARQKDLQYRIDIMTSILEIAEAEMQMLSQAMQSKIENPDDSSE